MGFRGSKMAQGPREPQENPTGLPKTAPTRPKGAQSGDIGGSRGAGVTKDPSSWIGVLLDGPQENQNGPKIPQDGLKDPKWPQ